MLPLFTFYYILAFINGCLTYSFEDLDISEHDLKYYMDLKLSESPASIAPQENIYIPYLFDTGVGNRQSLMIHDISIDKSFLHGKDVIDWNEITIRNRQYLVGKQGRKVCLIQIKIKHFTSEKFNTLYVNETTTEFEGEIGPIVLIKHINYTSGVKEGFALVTESNDENFQKIHWLKITKHGLERYDTWANPTRGEIIDLKWIMFDFTEYLVIVTREEHDFTTIDISEYKLQDDKMRLMCLDKVRVDYKVSSVSAVVEVEDLYLALVTPLQQNVWVYRYHLNFQKVGGFEVLQDFYIPNVTSATAFSQVGRQYFLTNGDSPNIILLNRNGTFTQQLHNCGPVTEWLVLRVPTYREDVILLARYGESISFLLWKGSLQGFTVAGLPPCYTIDSTMNKLNRVGENAECLSWCKWTSGAVLTLGHVPSLLLTCSQPNSEHQYFGGLYHFNVSLHPVLGPAQDIVNLVSRSNKLQDRVTELSLEFEEEGLFEGVDVSRGLLEEGWTSQWDGLTECLDQVEHQICDLSSYMEQRRQNDIRVNMSLHQGKLSGSASGLLANQPIQTTFKGQFRWDSDVKSSGGRFIEIESQVVINNNQFFDVRAKMKLDSLEVSETAHIDELRSTHAGAGYGISPEIHGPPVSTSTKQKELPIHHKIASDIYS